MSRNIAIQERERAEEQAKHQAHEHNAEHHHDAPQAHHLCHPLSTKVLWAISGICLLSGSSGFCSAIASPSGGPGIGPVILFGAIALIGVIAGVLAWDRKLVACDQPSRLASSTFGPSSVVRFNSGPRARARSAKDPRIHAAVLAASVVLLVLAIGVTEKSAYTQGHGVSEMATVESYNNSTSCGRTSCSTTFTADVSLPKAVGGLVSTTVHGNNSFSGFDAEQLAVLVDPRDPSYAELPGSPAHPASDLFILVALTGLLGFLTIAAILRLVHTRPELLPSRHLHEA